MISAWYPLKRKFLKVLCQLFSRVQYHQKSFCNLKVETDPLNLILYRPLLDKIDERSKFLILSRQIARAKSNSTIAGLQLGDYPCVHCCHVLPLSFAQSCHKVIIMNVVITIIIIIIITTRPKPAYGRQGLVGSWGQNTYEVSTFMVFLTSHFAPAVLSSDLTNLGPLMTMKIHLETLKNH